VSDANRIVLPELIGDENLVADLIGRCQRLILKHPMAAQAAYQALVAEGRRFAQTDEGKQWRCRLEASEAVRRARSLWEAATLNVLDADCEVPLPGQLIELVAQAVSWQNLETIVALITETAMISRAAR
jgi:hypothetical protein